MTHVASSQLPPLWSRAATGETALSRDAFDKVIEGTLPYIRIPNFASHDECRSIMLASDTHGFGSYSQVTPRIDRIGVTVFEYDSGDHQRYFDAAVAASNVRDQIFSEAGFNPLDRLQKHLREILKVRVSLASCPNGGNYFAGLIRRIEHGTLCHIDYAPTEHPAWSIAQVESQLVWNLYLDVTSGEGGETTIFNRQWLPTDEGYKESGSYGYNRRVVQNCESVTFRPQVGEVVIFNTRNFHEVASMQGGSRVTVTSAIGTLPDRSIVFWS